MFKKKDSSAEERNVRLMHHLDFTADDLAINRQGKLSERQYQYFDRVMKSASPLWMFLPLIIMVFGGGLILIQLNNEGFLERVGSPEFNILVVGLGGSFGLYAVFMFYAIYSGRKRSKMTPDQYEVRIMSGKVRGINTDMSTPIVKLGRYRLFSYQGGIGDAFVKGQHYTVYGIKSAGNMHYLLSAEAD